MTACLAMGSLFLAGCGTTTMGPGGVHYGIISGDVQYPSYREVPAVRYDFKGTDIDVLGPVTAHGSSYNILFLFGYGNNGYQLLLDEAKRKYPDMDSVMSITWDTSFNYFGWPFPYLPVYQHVDSIISGIAIKFKRK